MVLSDAHTFCAFKFCGLGNFTTATKNFGILNASAILRHRPAKQSKKNGSQDAVARRRGPILS
jgi:hypothetical protein